MIILVKGEQGTFEHVTDQPINLLHLLQEHDAEISAPCGGKGSCGKCRVNIVGVGSVLSCQTVLCREWAEANGIQPEQPLTIELPQYGKAQISSDGMMPEIVLAPLVNRGQVQLEPASILDQRSNQQRFEETSGLKIPYALLPQLFKIINSGNNTIEFVFRRDTSEVTRFLRPDTKHVLSVAVDIGTTTLAAWLYDLETGERLGVSSRYNPQRSFGADVISRIEQIDHDISNLQLMQKQIADAISGMTEEMLTTAGLKSQDVHCLSISGNTTMMHILCGLNPTAISRSPFIPVSISEQLLRAVDLNINISGDPICMLLPSISAYAGADITAGIIACGLFRSERASKLLVDLGTNGEIVLSRPGGMTACSTAAGPAFEAANISCGMSGISGAIDRVWLEEGDIRYTVIGGVDPQGLCGSGLVSAVAALLQAGVIDETGRLADDPEQLPAELSVRCSEVDGMNIFWLDRPGGKVYLSQRDVRELQNAKAAVAAGVMRLLKQTGMHAEELDEILLAGGFGYYLNVEDAYKIGLLPPGANDRTRAVGNTSGMGSIACMLNDELRQNAAIAAASVEYYELSSDPIFTELYIEAMMFPEQE